MSAFDTNFYQMARARFPLLLVVSPEEERVVATIERLAHDPRIKTARRVWTWRITTGLCSEGETVPNTNSPYDTLEWIVRHEEPAVFVLCDFHVCFGSGIQSPELAVVRRLRDLASILRSRPQPQTLVLLAPLENLPVELKADVTILDFPLPTEAEMQQLLHTLAEAHSLSVDESTATLLAKAAAGLTLREAENAFARALVQDGRLDAADVEGVLDEKRQIIRKSGILEFIDSRCSLDDVGGLDVLKRWLTRRGDAWSDEAAEYSLSAPRGVLITGVPGCGKSLVAKSVSALWHLPLLRLDIGRVYSGLIGSSEANIRSALSVAEAIAPCVLWIDEIEKGLGNAGGAGGERDGGTSARIFGTVLTWMQEKSKPVFVVATANDIASLPPEFLRKGRFDEIFFVDLPDEAERTQIWKLHLQRRLHSPRVRGQLPQDTTLLRDLVAASEGFSGAEIESAVVAALFEAFADRRELRREDLLQAIKATVPLNVIQAERVAAIREWAALRAVAASSSQSVGGTG